MSNAHQGIPVPRTPVRVRIAPSPTGDPHVGTAYIALFNLAFARAHEGQFVLRIEDTDQKRSSPESERAILKSLRWCGLQWDEGPDVGGPYGPYRQSERSALYVDHCQTLVAQRRAYPCFCSAERLDRVRAAQKAAGEDWRYDGHCRQLDPAAAQARIDAGDSHVVRLAMPQVGSTTVLDALRGAVVVENHRVDDQILLKSDGLPTYHLANVVDDHLMEITHVIRAEEWINSTPKHLELYDAFGWQPPVFIHMPLLRNADKSKISKRKNPVSLAYYQRAGILPEAFLNFLSLLGYSMPDEREIFSMQDFIDALDLTRISLGGPVFDLAKLEHINGLYLRAMTPAALADRAHAWLREDDRHQLVAELVQERVPTLAAWNAQITMFYGGKVTWDDDARHLLVGCGSRKKKSVRLNAKRSRAMFDDLVGRLEGLRSWQTEGIEMALRAAVERAGALVGDGFMAVRVAISGRTASPPLFESIEALGRAVTLVRLRAASDWLRGQGHLDAEIGALEKQIAALRLSQQRLAEAQSAGGRFDPSEG